MDRKRTFCNCACSEDKGRIKKTKKLNKMRSKKEIVEKIKELEEEISDKKKLDIEKINIAGMLRALRWVLEEEK